MRWLVFAASVVWLIGFTCTLGALGVALFTLDVLDWRVDTLLKVLVGHFMVAALVYLWAIVFATWTGRV